MKQWIKRCEDYYCGEAGYECSECGEWVVMVPGSPYKYCPYCGAQMTLGIEQ